MMDFHQIAAWAQAGRLKYTVPSFSLHQNSTVKNYPMDEAEFEPILQNKPHG